MAVGEVSVEQNKKLTLKRETVKMLSVQTGVRAGTNNATPVIYGGGVGPGPIPTRNPTPGGGYVVPPPVFVSPAFGAFGGFAG